jgi:hypothetical protein
MPVGHFLPISKHFSLLEEQIDKNGRFIINGSQEEPVWREEHEINEISLEGEWSGGVIDSEWINSNLTNEESEAEEAS